MPPVTPQSDTDSPTSLQKAAQSALKALEELKTSISPTTEFGVQLELHPDLESTDQ